MGGVIVRLVNITIMRYTAKFFTTTIICLWLLAGFIAAVIPFPVKKGWHGAGGEFCGIVYEPSCDQTTVRFFTYSEIVDIVKANAL